MPFLTLIARLEFKLAYNDAGVLHVSHYVIVQEYQQFKKYLFKTYILDVWKLISYACSLLTLK